MKTASWASAVLIVSLAAAAPVARADHGDVGAAAALGFVLGTLVNPPAVVYGAPPPVIYQPPPQVVIPPPTVYGYAPPPPVRYYYYDYGRPRWNDGWRHREWHGRGHSRWRHDDD